jgi:putative peptidoglycan lipid II flippase
MVYATLAGTLFQALIVAFLLERHGYHFSLRWHGSTEAVREVGRQYGPILLSSLVASGGLLVDQSMAAGLAPGSVSALVYSSRFVAVALALMAGAISTAVLPSLSRLVAHGDWAACRATVNHWVFVSLAASVPIAAALVFGARLLVSTSLEHGAFGPKDTAVVTSVLAMYALQIPFSVASRVDFRLIVAARRTDLILSCGIVNLALDVVLNIVLMRTMGVAGIALATSLWTVSSFLYLRFWSLRLMHRGEAAQS